MNKLKYMAATAGASAALVFGMAAPVAASTSDSYNDNSQETTTVNVDVDKSNNVNGDCSAILIQDVDQDQNTSSNQSNNNSSDDNDPENKVEDDVKAENNQSNSSSNSSDQSNSSSNSQSNNQSFEADCSSTTNVTNVNEGDVLGSRVKAPAGGIGAGLGSTATSTQSLLGLFGSLGTTGLGLGVRFLKKES